MICPNCQSDVAVTEKDFGALFNCPKCQAGYFINFDGAPEYSDLPPPDLSTESNSHEHLDIAAPNGTQSSTNEPQNQFNENFSTNENEVPLAEQPSTGQDFPTFENNDFQTLDSFSTNNEMAADSLLEPQFGESAFSNVASDISHFGNSETQISSLNYDLRIIGLDTREDLLAFKEQIEDARFAWDVSDLMKQIKNGELLLPRLSPVQAYILAKRLHFLDVEMKWKQNVLE